MGDQRQSLKHTPLDTHQKPQCTPSWKRPRATEQSRSRPCLSRCIKYISAIRSTQILFTAYFKDLFWSQWSSQVKWCTKISPHLKSKKKKHPHVFRQVASVLWLIGVCQCWVYNLCCCRRSKDCCNCFNHVIVVFCRLNGQKHLHFSLMSSFTSISAFYRGYC